MKRRISEDIEWTNLVGDVSRVQTADDVVDIKVLLLLSSRCVVGTVGSCGVYTITAEQTMPFATAKTLASSTPMRPISGCVTGTLQWDFKTGIFCVFCGFLGVFCMILTPMKHDRWFPVCIHQREINCSLFFSNFRVCACVVSRGTRKINKP